MNSNTTNAIVRSLGVMLLGLGAALHPVQAQTVTASASVVASDLDLGSAAGAATLKHRIEVAVGQVCGTADARDLQEMADYDHCRQAATASATAQMQQRMAEARQTTVMASSTPR
jgi:UrcA family protein